MDELRKARLTLSSKEGGYLKARDSTLRHEQSEPNTSLGGSVTSVASDHQKRRKELEKKRKTEEDALVRVSRLHYSVRARGD